MTGPHPMLSYHCFCLALKTQQNVYDKEGSHSEMATFSQQLQGMMSSMYEGSMSKVELQHSVGWHSCTLNISLVE